MSFDQLNLNPNISKAIKICGYDTPTAIQSRCIPDILKGKDLIASAQTGTGKTASFVLPALHRLASTPTSNKPRVLILTPTRELARQITDAVTKYGKFMKVNIVSLVGGMPYGHQLRDLSRKVDIIVATPGRLMDHMSNRRLDLSGIEILVLDEADRMLDMGFVDDVKEIAKATPTTRQTLLFSATVDEKLSHIARHLLKDPVRINLSHEKQAPSQIKQRLLMADSASHKTKLLQHILKNENVFKAIIFSATKINADRLAKDLQHQGFSATALHSDLKQKVRNRTIEELRRGKIQFLIATDIVSRGIDISDISHVINYDLPKFSEDYVHRIGRVGRAGKTGIAISFALPADMRHLKKIEHYMGGQKIEKEVIVGLEPTKNASSSDFSNKPRSNPKRRFGGGGKSFSSDRDNRDRSNKSFSGRSDKPFADKGKPASDRSGSKSFSGRSDKPFADKGKPASDRSSSKSFSGRSDKPFADKGKPASDRSGKPFSGKPFSDKPSFGAKKRSPKKFGGERKFN